MHLVCIFLLVTCIFSICNYNSRHTVTYWLLWFQINILFVILKKKKLWAAEIMHKSNTRIPQLNAFLIRSWVFLCIWVLLLFFRSFFIHLIVSWNVCAPHRTSPSKFNQMHYVHGFSCRFTYNLYISIYLSQYIYIYFNRMQ